MGKSPRPAPASPSPDVKPSASVPAELCVECGYLFDAATALEGNETPNEGSISVCVNCGYATIFTGDLRRRKMTAAEHDALPPKLKVILAAARRYVRERYLRPLPRFHRRRRIGPRHG